MPWPSLGRQAPDTLHLAPANRVQAWLAAIGVPWTESRASLIRRLGVRTDGPMAIPVVRIKLAPSPLPGLLRPLECSVLPQIPHRPPPGTFYGTTWFGDDADDNLRRTVDALTVVLGPSTESDVSNTRGRLWRDGAASVAATVWPPHLQRQGGANAAHAADPRLITACHVTIRSGLRLPLSAAERGWLDSFRKIASIADRFWPTSAASVATTVPGEADALFVREPPADVTPCYGHVGRSSAALIFCLRQLVVVPLSAVVEYRVERTLPAKGGGGARIEVLCTTDEPHCPSLSLQIATASGPEDFNALAATLSDATEKPFRLGEHLLDD